MLDRVPPRGGQAATDASSKPRPRRWTWRRRLVNWHRDVGFFVVGLTVIYAISGIAVNHHHHWNYNERTTRTARAVGQPADLLFDLSPSRRVQLRAAPTALDDSEAALLASAVSQRLGYPTPPRNSLWRGPTHLLMFYGPGDREVVEYSPVTGVAEHIERRDRAILRDLNYLHLNEARGWWTWVADGYAILLLFLAVSGTLVVRGRKGLAGRGGLLLALGVAVPLLGLMLRHF